MMAKTAHAATVIRACNDRPIHSFSLMLATNEHLQFFCFVNGKGSECIQSVRDCAMWTWTWCEQTNVINVVILRFENDVRNKISQ